MGARAWKSPSTQADGLGAVIDSFQKAGAGEAFNTLAAESGDVMLGPAHVRLDEVLATTAERVEGQSVVAWTRTSVAGGHVAAATETSSATAAQPGWTEFSVPVDR